MRKARQSKGGFFIFINYGLTYIKYNVMIIPDSVSLPIFQSQKTSSGKFKQSHPPHNKPPHFSLMKVLSTLGLWLALSAGIADFFILWIQTRFKYAKDAYNNPYDPYQKATFRSRRRVALLKAAALILAVFALSVFVIALTINWFTGRYGSSVLPFLAVPLLWLLLAPGCWRFLHLGALAIFCKEGKSA
jgi:hypothetical protein